MKKSNKIYHLIINFVLLIPLLLQGIVGIQTVKADTTDTGVNVTLHKRAFDKMPADKQNTGDVMNDFGGEGLNGVSFTAYDVTGHFLELRKSGSEAEAAVKEIQEDSKNQVPSYATEVKSQTTATQNGEDGLATFENLPLKDNKGNYKTYLFVETNSPTNVTQKAVPIVLNMPIYKAGSDTDINTNVQVYPKNEKTDNVIKKDLDDESKKQLIVKLPDGSTVYNAQYGDTFGYNISVTVPWNIKDKDTFTVVDTPSNGIKVKTDSIKISGLTAGTDYTVSDNGDGYKVTFKTNSSAVQGFAGKELKISYQATLTNSAVPDQVATNEAELNIGNGTDVTTTPANDTPDIYTGGAKFVKTDKDNSNKTLAGAEFQLVKLDKNGDISAYANLTSDGYSWNKDATNVTTFTSNQAGLFTVKGLSYSDKLAAGESYAMVETKAPEGYAKLTAPIKFNVTKGSYADSQKITVSNIHKGLLPSTGGHGIYLYLLAGVLIIVVAATGYYFSKRREEV